MNRKLIASTSVLLLSVFSLLILSKQSLFLSMILVLIAYMKHRVIPTKRELLWFGLISVGGLVVEIILVNVANEWRYASPHIFGVPVWMPLFWGVIGTTIVPLYEGLIEK